MRDNGGGGGRKDQISDLFPEGQLVGSVEEGGGKNLRSWVMGCCKRQCPGGVIPGEGSYIEAPASSARLVCRAWPHTLCFRRLPVKMATARCTWFLETSCGWVGKGLDQRAEIT